MRIRLLRAFLYLLCFAQLALSVCLIYWANSPIPVFVPAEPVEAEPTEQQLISNGISLTTFKSHWNRHLQRPLFDPPQSVEAEIEPPRPLELNLIGTVIERGSSTALISGEDGRVRFCKVGDLVGTKPSQATVQEIQSTTVRLAYDDQEILLEIPVTN